MNTVLVYFSDEMGTQLHALRTAPTQRVQLAFGYEQTEWNWVYLGALSGANNFVDSNAGVTGQ